MSDDTLSAAIKEAYAVAPSDVVIYHTLEIRHSSFATPIRVVRDNATLSATLEAGDAPDNARRRVEQLQDQQQQLLAQIRREIATLPPPDPQREAGTPQEREQEDRRRQLLRQVYLYLLLLLFHRWIKISWTKRQPHPISFIR